MKVVIATNGRAGEHNHMPLSRDAYSRGNYEAIEITKGAIMAETYKDIKRQLDNLTWGNQIGRASCRERV